MRMFDMDFILANVVPSEGKVNPKYLERQKITFEIYVERHVEQRRKDFEKLAALMESGGTIRNQEYIGLKWGLDKAVEECYENFVDIMFSRPDTTRAAMYDAKLNVTKNMMYELRPTAVLSIAATGKKVAKIKMAGATEMDKKFIDAVTKLVEVFAPVQAAFVKLKAEGRIVKGRAPRAEPIPENPNKDVKTCPVCFGKYAVHGGKEAGGVGKIVHHGFERPGDGFQTASCPAAMRFQCLEVSTDGLVWYIGLLVNEIKNLKKTMKELPKQTELRNPRFHYEDQSRARRQGKEYKIPEMLQKATTDAFTWNQTMEGVESRLSYRLSSTQETHAHRQKVLDNWVPGKGAY